ncbi:LLM class F420-dependent oxidoreductase [Rhodococcus sp. SJ-3]|uniref:LLM class F420-dependent oxidoreductase n=1 Tax=Rhodococcus sp. SJ-3 TaxID=3454628 RepID=UPI003F7A6782
MTLKFNLMFPMRAVKHYPQWIGDGSLGKAARVIEDAGFDGFSMSEHPYPDKDWLADGGHHAFDPFVSLSMAAEATQRIRLITYVMVAGYRSPYLGAKSASSLDVLSGGRLTLGMAAGYLKPEFDALGADFARRGKLLDEAIAAMRATWVGAEHTGSEFAVSNHISLPLPTQAGGPPIWIGGNSKAAQRRAVESGDGWMPMAQNTRTAEITRTPALENIDTLRSLITAQNKRRAEMGKPDMDVSFVPFEKDLLRTANTATFCTELVPRLDEYREAGITWITIEPSSRSYDDFVGDIELMSETLIRR